MHQHRNLDRLTTMYIPGRSPQGPRRRSVQLVCNPADDLAFAGAAEGFVARGAGTPAGLQRLLQDDYPNVLVRARGLSSEEFDAWYVYRDGSWTPSRPVDGMARR